MPFPFSFRSHRHTEVAPTAPAVPEGDGPLDLTASLPPPEPTGIGLSGQSPDWLSMPSQMPKEMVQSLFGQPEIEPAAVEFGTPLGLAALASHQSGWPPSATGSRAPSEPVFEMPMAMAVAAEEHRQPESWELQSPFGSAETASGAEAEQQVWEKPSSGPFAASAAAEASSWEKSSPPPSPAPPVAEKPVWERPFPPPIPVPLAPAVEQLALEQPTPPPMPMPPAPAITGWERPAPPAIAAEQSSEPLPASGQPPLSWNLAPPIAVVEPAWPGAATPTVVAAAPAVDDKPSWTALAEAPVALAERPLNGQPSAVISEPSAWNAAPPATTAAEAPDLTSRESAELRREWTREIEQVKSDLFGAALGVSALKDRLDTLEVQLLQTPASPTPEAGLSKDELIAWMQDWIESNVERIMETAVAKALNRVGGRVPVMLPPEDTVALAAALSAPYPTRHNLFQQPPFIVASSAA